MIASKYFPHYLGLNMLFHHNFHAHKSKPGEPGGKTPELFFLLTYFENRDELEFVRSNFRKIDEFRSRDSVLLRYL
jgi:hypothetical protein